MNFVDNNMRLPQIRAAMTDAEQALHNALLKKIRRLYEHDQLGMHMKVLRFHRHLDDNYTDLRDYCLFHLLTGSTLKTDCPHFDFPLPDSIADFINTEFAAVFPQ